MSHISGQGIRREKVTLLFWQVFVLCSCLIFSSWKTLVGFFMESVLWLQEINHECKMPMALWNFATKSALPSGFQNFIKPSTMKAAIRRCSFLLQLFVHSLCWPHVAHNHSGSSHCHSTSHMVKPIASKPKKSPKQHRPDWNKTSFSGSALQKSIITMMSVNHKNNTFACSVRPDKIDWLTVPFWESECTHLKLKKEKKKIKNSCH